MEDNQNEKPEKKETETETETVLVTGASGFLGGRICQALLSRGDCHVKALVRPSSSLHSLPPNHVELVHGDVTDLQSLLRAFHGCSVIIHSAAIVTPWVPDSSKFFMVRICLSPFLVFVLEHVYFRQERKTQNDAHSFMRN